MSERRAKRSAVPLPVSIGRKAAALSADVSTDGFCLESPTFVAAGAEVTGYVLHGDKELPWSGRVVWAQPGNPMLSTWHRMGVQFTHVSAGLRALISMRLR